MFCTVCLAFMAIYCATVKADISHLKSLGFSKNINHFQTFSGYNYDPPSPQLPIPAPPPFTTTFLPEIIVNKEREPANMYLPPPTPSTESSIVIHPPNDFDMTAYLPPMHDELPPPEPVEPPQSYLPPETVPDNQYLPPSALPPQADDPTGGYQYSPPKKSKLLKHGTALLNTKSNALHISVNSLRCLEGNGGYFQANIAVQSFIENLPIIDSDTIDSRCQFHLIGVRVILNIPIEDFQRCGITPCSNKELCVNVRFPQIFGMKSLDDSLLTLKCMVQERVVSKMHAFRFGVSQNGQARNSVVFAHGGAKQNIRTQLGLYRQSGGGFSKSLESGAFVQLGEELMLRAQVKHGDGWNHSRISDVSMQRVGSNGEILNTATLIKSNGCANPKMQSILLLPPVFEHPLGYRFAFRAVMFQGMKSGDEMVMNVRIIGCMDHHDCHFDHVNCANDQSPGSSSRFRRHTNAAENTDETYETIEVSNISFRVMLPSDFQKMHSRNHASGNIERQIAIFLTVAVVCFLILVILFIIKKEKHRPFFVWDKY